MARKTTRRPGGAGPRNRPSAATGRTGDASQADQTKSAAQADQTEGASQADGATGASQADKSKGASQADATPDSTPETDAPATPPQLSEADAQPDGERPAETRPAALPEDAKGGSEAEATPDAATPSGTSDKGASQAEARPDAGGTAAEAAAKTGAAAKPAMSDDPKKPGTDTGTGSGTDTDKATPSGGAAISESSVPKAGRRTGTTTTGAPKTETASSKPATEAPASGSATLHKPTPATAAVDQGTTTRPATGATPEPGRKRDDAAATTGSATPTGATTKADTPPPARDDGRSKSGGSGSAVTAGLLGGVLGAALALGAGWLWLGNAGDETEARLTALEQELAALPPATDLTPLTEELSGLREETQGGLADLGARIDEAESRIAALETRLDEGGDGTLAEAAVARWQGEVDALRERLQAQADEIAAMAETAAGEISAAESTAAQLEAEAAAVAARAQARAVLATVEAALETGEPYADTIEELQAASPAPVPEPLVTHAEEGVASRAELVESFPESARAALALARREGLSGEEGGRALGFLRDTFQLRSTAPSEGGSVDAVLSRAEAALREGRLKEALAEIETLPDPVREEIAAWTATARDRAAALAAAGTLSQSLTEN
ncbi:hypothetical protein [Limimaricola pyoseonensis]|uniref:Inner membrane protein n=1 Tax=Limimaricola pyoseonensis TaxID=521013 RepID=A0A1G7EKJ3_9RHOB|nr:hypothetical protein [Limimaricola pyoseonensis]SDE63916.1 hypothetical protein SAMN04488567_2196 [Limimaricola pyoseonensis]